MAIDKKEGHSGVEQAGCAYQRKIRMMVCKQEGGNVQSNINTLIIQKVSSYRDLDTSARTEFEFKRALNCV